MLFRSRFFVFRNEHAQCTTLGPKPGFAQYCCRTSPILKTVVGGAYKARVFATGTISSFFARTCPIHYFRSKTLVWGGFSQFRCSTSPIPKTGVGCIQSTSFLPQEPFLRFSQRTWWFGNTKCIYTSCHDLISKILQFD